jgi:hypothetical protein
MCDQLRSFLSDPCRRDKHNLKGAWSTLCIGVTFPERSINAENILDEGSDVPRSLSQAADGANLCDCVKFLGNRIVR